MVARQVLNAYRKTQVQADIHPVKLIYMMYERVLTHLEQAEIGVRKNAPQMRGENLGRAIAIITELNASIKQDDDSDAANFLRGLYGAILVELPKISISGDIKILRRAHAYMQELKETWEETAMREAGFMDKKGEEEVSLSSPEKLAASSELGSSPVESTTPSGVSVSI